MDERAEGRLGHRSAQMSIGGINSWGGWVDMRVRQPTVFESDVGARIMRRKLVKGSIFSEQPKQVVDILLHNFWLYFVINFATYMHFKKIYLKEC